MEKHPQKMETDNEVIDPEALEEVGVEPTPPQEETASEPAPADDVLGRLEHEMGILREMLNRLTESREAPPAPPEKKSRRQEMENMEQFHALFPDASVADIPDEVWTSVEEEGLPLAAAFALWTRREELRRQSAKAQNLKNAKGWGRADSAKQTDDLSPDEVRAMSPVEVRRHYSRIIASMKHWK